LSRRSIGAIRVIRVFIQHLKHGSEFALNKAREEGHVACRGIRRCFVDPTIDLWESVNANRLHRRVVVCSDD
jgi:hypothetical protein